MEQIRFFIDSKNATGNSIKKYYSESLMNELNGAFIMFKAIQGIEAITSTKFTTVQFYKSKTM